MRISALGWLLPVLGGVLGSLGMMGSVGAIIHGEDVYDHGSLDPLRAPMLENVGQMGRKRSGSVVYLGKKWILTANHAFEGRSGNVVIFSGKEYQLRAGDAVRLKSHPTAGRPGMTDLVMVPLKSAPDLPELKINEHMPFCGERVVMVGCGSSVGRGGVGGGEVRPISGGEPARAAGPRWGENEIAQRNIEIGVPGGVARTRSYATIRQPNRQVCNAQGAPGDSGGGIFVKRGDRWQLSGIMLSVAHREDLNAGATFSADLSVYREQIEATIPEPSSAVLVMLGLVCGGLRRRRR